MALAMRYVQAHISEEISVEQLARLCSYSPSTFHAKFKQATGLPPHEYILRKKIDSACILLANGRYTVREVAGGFPSAPSNISARCLKNICQLPPALTAGRFPAGGGHLNAGQFYYEGVL